MRFHHDRVSALLNPTPPRVIGYADSAIEPPRRAAFPAFLATLEVYSTQWQRYRRCSQEFSPSIARARAGLRRASPRILPVYIDTGGTIKWRRRSRAGLGYICVSIIHEDIIQHARSDVVDCRRPTYRHVGIGVHGMHS